MAQPAEMLGGFIGAAVVIERDGVDPAGAFRIQNQAVYQDIGNLKIVQQLYIGIILPNGPKNDPIHALGPERLDDFLFIRHAVIGVKQHRAVSESIGLLLHAKGELRIKRVCNVCDDQPNGIALPGNQSLDRYKPDVYFNV